MKKSIFSPLLPLLFMLMVTACSVSYLSNNDNAKNTPELKLLYWNIQNGMWSDQGNNYDNFVKFVSEQNPDVCVWCEAKSNYKTGSAEGFSEKMYEYLPSNWDVIAKRYGHDYVYLGGFRDGFPQVITAKYPIENVQRIVGERPDSVVSHGAGWALLHAPGRDINIVTLHTWPQKYGFEIPSEKREESKLAHEGDHYRKMELEYICKHSILTVPQAKDQLWMMMGDFNSISSLDNDHYGYPADTTAFIAIDYVLNNTPYVDAIREFCGSDFQSTILSGRRIDYVFMTSPLYEKVTSVKVLRDGWVSNYRDPQGLSNFCHPSDHMPVVVTWKF